MSSRHDPRPGADARRHGTPDAHIWVAALVALLIGALGSTGRLLEIAERMEFGDDRDRWVAAATRLDEAANRVGADRPARGIDALLGRSTGDDTTVVPVLGDLAGSTTTTTPTTPTTVAPQPAPSIERPEPESPTTTLATLPPDTAVTLPDASNPGERAPIVMRQPDPTDPLRVWVGGDSLGEYVGSAFTTDLGGDMATVALDFHIATGLARPDYFDWPAQLTSVMASEAERPEAIVFMVGGNDDQSMRVDDGTALLTGSTAWIAEYQRRAGAMMDITAYEGVHLYWLLLPPMADDQRDDVADKINAAVRLEASSRPWVTAVDLDPLLADEAGEFAPRRPDPATGDERAARQDDGVHITRRASRWIAAIVIEEIERRWALG